MELWEQALVTFWLNIFSSTSYEITGVSVSYKKNIGQWVAVQNRIVVTQDSRSARGNLIILHHTCSQAHIRDCMPVDGHGKHTPKIISFMKACVGHMRRIFLHPALLLYLISVEDCIDKRIWWKTKGIDTQYFFSVVFHNVIAVSFFIIRQVITNKESCRL